MRQAYLDGLEDDESVPLSFREDEELPVAKRVVNTGQDVIDLAEMREELEKHNRAKRGGA